jgi:DNA-binding transcriptional MerR regulator
MNDLITLNEAAQTTASNPSTLRGWIAIGVISGAVAIKSRGRAGGRRGYYPASLPYEIAIATIMSNNGYSLDAIAGARKLAQSVLDNPSGIGALIEEPITGPAARFWLTLYADLTCDQTATQVLKQAQKLTEMILRNLMNLKVE